MLENSTLGTKRNPLRRKQNIWSMLAGRYYRTHKCIISSAVLTILLSTFTVALILCELLLNSDNYYHSTIWKNGTYNSSIIFVILVDLIGIFYPIAGYLADNKFGRYATVRFSLVFLLLPSALLGVSYVILTFVLPAVVGVSAEDPSYSAIIYWCLAGLLDMAICVGVVGFFANIIQFGMDQIYDYPAEVQSLFIHWFWWSYYAAELITQLTWFMSQLPCSAGDSDLDITHCQLSVTGHVLSSAIFLTLFCLLLLSSCLISLKKSWFLIEPSSINPYKLVLKVTKFAYKNRTPLNRSAFTYCEDEVPTGLDVGKDKYGGPFTTEQVEDVKVFYGIFLILLSLGPVFSLHAGANGSLYLFALHESASNHSLGNSSWNITAYNGDVTKMLLVNYGVLTPLLMTLLIPLHLFFIRPLFLNYIPGMLKRIGIGIVFDIVSVACTSIEQVMSQRYHDKGCVFYGNPATVVSQATNGTVFDQPLIDTNVLIVQRTLSALSTMLINIAAYEFICSQSPHSMKGLLIGLAYAMKGLFQTLSSAMLVALPLTSSRWCGEAWYFINFGLGVAALVLYSVVARKYRYRKRNDTCNIYKFAEEYYSKVQ